MQLFLKPIIQELLKLETSGEGSKIYTHCSILLLCFFFLFFKGVDIDPPGIGKPLTMTVHVIACSCDLPAKALVQNFMQFNGFFGCGFCEQSGTSIRTDSGGTVLAFLYDNHLPKGPSRTQQKCIQYAQDAIKRCSSVGL